MAETEGGLAWAGKREDAGLMAEALLEEEARAVGRAAARAAAARAEGKEVEARVAVVTAVVTGWHKQQGSCIMRRQQERY